MILSFVRFSAFVLAFIAFGCGADHIYAKNEKGNTVHSPGSNSTWGESEKRLKAIYSQGSPLKQQCLEGWSILWPLAKEGNLEARRQLAQEWLYMGRRMPGHEDRVSSMRDFAILAIHASGAKHSSKGPDVINEMFKNGYGLFYLGKSDVECFLSSPSPLCANQAVKNMIVPSFEDFSKEIDAQILVGKNSMCLGSMLGDEVYQK